MEERGKQEPLKNDNIHDQVQKGAELFQMGP